MSETGAHTDTGEAPLREAFSPIARAPVPVRQLTSLQRLGNTVQAAVEEGGARGTFYVQRLGVPGALGLTLIVFAIAFLQSTWRPLYQSVLQSRAELQTIQKPGKARAQPHRRPETPSSSAAHFMEKLPTRDELPAVLSAFIAQAQATGIQLEHGTYEWNVRKAGSIARYRISLPVSGNYPDIRRFIEATLQAVPAAALTGFTLRRKDVTSGQVDADLGFVVYVRSRP